MVADFIRSTLLLRSPKAARRAERKRRNRFERLEPRYVLDTTLVFNELMYHPRAEDGPEWFELHNQQGVDLDISNWRLEGGVEFYFAEGTVVPRRGFLVVSADPENTNAHEDALVLGPFAGSLANNGETIRLVNMNDREMDSIDYEDSYPWPCLLYTSPSPRDATLSRMPSSA